MINANTTRPDGADNTVRYFAYGSNLNTQHLSDFLRRHHLAPDCITPVGRGRLAGYELCFDYYSVTWSGGALNMRPSPGAFVDGVLFEVCPEGWMALDAKEGAPSFYARVPVLVKDEQGNQVEAITYVSERREGHVCPPVEYLDIVQSGYRDHGLPVEPLHVAAGVEPEGVFVYGTLLQGESRHDMLLPAVEVLEACRQARLFDLGSYPGMLPPLRPTDVVHGQFVRVAGLDGLLERLDLVEGFRQAGDPDNLFERRIVTVEAGDGRSRQAWAWFYNHGVSDEQRVLCGDWRARRWDAAESYRGRARRPLVGEERMGRIRIVERVPQHGEDLTRLKVYFGPHHFLHLEAFPGGVTLALGYTHHGFRLDASELGGPLEQLIDQVRREQPDLRID